MNIYKTFFVETSPDGKTRFYNVGKRFFSGKRNSGGLMERFDADEAGAKDYYMSELKKGGWQPLSNEDIDKINVNEIGLVTAYPFKCKKGFMSIGKIEELALEKGYEWKRKDHLTNPFSALDDYSDFVGTLPEDKAYDIGALRSQISVYADKLRDIGAIEAIENYITANGVVPDPRRFNKTKAELRRYYKLHLTECGRMILHKHLAMPDEVFSLDNLMAKLEEINPLSSLISNKAHNA